MAKLNLPDGRTISFPDGLSPDQVSSIVEAASSNGGQNAEIGAMLPDAKVPQRDDRIRAQYDALPGWQKPIVAADDILTLTGQGIGMGLPEKGIANLKAWWNGTDYETERGKIDQSINDSRARSGMAGGVANIAGAVAGPAALAKAGLTATRLPGAAGKLFGLTADGAAIGAATAYGNDMDVTTGAVVGGGLGAAGQAVVGAGAKLLSPFLPNAERAAAAKVLQAEGVPVTAGQKSGSKALRNMESELGGAAAENLMEKQGEKFTSAILKRVGESADRATPEVMNRALDRIGKGFDDLASRNTMVPDQRVAADLTQIAVDYASLVAPSQRIGMIEKTANEVIGLLQNGNMNGSVYKTLRSSLDRFARGTSQPEARMAARDLIQALDGGMERSILRTNPADAGKWSKVRSQYRNIIAVEDAVTGTGENSAAGIISPAKLRSATVRKHGKRNYARGKGDYAELARAGEAVLSPLPNSGTAGRLAARGLFAGIGGGFGYNQDGLEGLAKGAVLGGLAPWATGKALLSRPGQAYLGNRVAAPLTPEMKDALARMLSMSGLGGYIASTSE